MVSEECGVRNAECGIAGDVERRFDLPFTLRTPHSTFRITMSVQAIAWSPTGAVRIIDQRALPEARIERDLESAEVVAAAIRTLQVRGAPLIGIAAAMGDRKSTRLNSSHLVISYAVFCLKKKNRCRTPRSGAFGSITTTT